jgi:hypothetical protein
MGRATGHPNRPTGDSLTDVSGVIPFCFLIVMAFAGRAIARPFRLEAAAGGGRRAARWSA